MTKADLVDPKLPKYFDATPNGERPESHQKWWFHPYLVTSGGGYVLRVLDGGAWDRSSNKGSFPTLDQALEAARTLTEEYRPYRDLELREVLFLLWHKNATVLDTGEDGKLTPRPMRPEDVQI